MPRNREFTIFDNNQLSTMVAVGMTSSTSARIWAKSDKPGRGLLSIGRKAGRWDNSIDFSFSDKDADYTTAIDINSLKPLTRYFYQVVRQRDNALIGEGHFETSPKGHGDMPDKVSIALMSCHQPFDDGGRLDERRMRLLKRLPNILKENDIKFILLAGDQIYSDVPYERSLFNPHYTAKMSNPQGQSIFDWDAKVVREAYHERYRIFWHPKEVQHFYANYPCYPILDDHEIEDDWGARIAHQYRRYANIRKGALEAYLDYQASRIINRPSTLPRAFDYNFVYGDIGVFVMDLRSERKAQDQRRGRRAQLFSYRQYSRLERFLKSNKGKRVIIIMTSVPVIHMPDWMADFGGLLAGHSVDFPDHWTHYQYLLYFDNFMHLLYKHQMENPKQKMIIASGDVHIGCAFRIKWRGRNQPVLYQLTSSAISNRNKEKLKNILTFPTKKVKKIKCDFDGTTRTADVSLLAPPGEGNPYAGLNIGIIEVEKGSETSKVMFKLFSYPDDDSDKYTEVYASVST